MPRVTDYVADMVALEQQMVALVSDLTGEVEHQPHAASELRRIEQTAQENLTSLRIRLSTLSAAERAAPELIARRGSGT